MGRGRICCGPILFVRLRRALVEIEGVTGGVPLAGLALAGMRCMGKLTSVH
jgi:hypothetical protein